MRFLRLVANSRRRYESMSLTIFISEFFESVVRFFLEKKLEIGE